MKPNGTSHTLKHWYDFDSKIVLQGIIVGALTGIVVVVYRVLINYAAGVRENLYALLKRGSIVNVVGWFLVLIGLGVIVGLMVKKAPMIKGSGIPQIKGFLLRQLKLTWLVDLILKFVGGVLTLGFGLSLGREGPSVQLGGTIGLGFSRVFKRFHLEEKYLVTAGASAGLAAAFNAPLAGVVFALEELHRSISPIMLACVMAAAVTGDFVSSHFLGLGPVFDFKNMAILPSSDYIYLIILGVIIAALGKAFNQSLLWMQAHYGQSPKLNEVVKPILPFICAGILGMTLPSVLGGGHELIVELSQINTALAFLVLIFVVKFAFTVLCYGSGAPGGIFLPILVLGALVGKGFGDSLVTYAGMDPSQVLNFIVLAMAAYFTAVVRAPITGSILITEMTGSFNHLLPLITVCLVAYVVTDLLHSGAIYDNLLENMLRWREPVKEGNWLKEAGEKKVVLEIAVSLNSRIENKKIKDLSWPSDCLIVGIRRGEKELIPNGDSKLFAGDFLFVLTDEENAAELGSALLKMAEEPKKNQEKGSDQIIQHTDPIMDA